jgi:nicotinamidase-related amidase
MKDGPVNATSEHALDALRAVGTNPAVVTIDLHRGHLDPTVATLPLPAEAAAALMKRTVPLLDGLRAAGLPVIHLVTRYRNREEILSNPYWAMQSGRPGGVRRAIAEHNLEGMPGLELMPGIRRAGDLVIDTKKRYDCFVGTELEFVLRSGGHDSSFRFGVNTNSCVIATAIAASVRDWAVFVVEDGVDSMMGEEFHRSALAIMDGSFAWVVTGSDLLEALRARSGSESARPNGGDGAAGDEGAPV